jgi:hypothetical protein
VSLKPSPIQPLPEERPGSTAAPIRTSTPAAVQPERPELVPEGYVYYDTLGGKGYWSMPPGVPNGYRYVKTRDGKGYWVL